MGTRKLNRSPTEGVHDKKTDTPRRYRRGANKIELPARLTVVRRDVLLHVPLFQRTRRGESLRANSRVSPNPNRKNQFEAVLSSLFPEKPRKSATAAIAMCNQMSALLCSTMPMSGSFP
jgi:hypothetical protein